MSGLPESITVDPCGDPEPAGTFDDVIVVVPAEMNVLEFEGFPDVDWEIAICDEQGRVLDLSINDVLLGCESAVGHPMVPVGCVERARASVLSGQAYVLRAFNFADPHDLLGRYRFGFEPPTDYGPSPPAASPPTAGRLTRLYVTGNRGQILQIPKVIPLTREGISLELLEGTYALVVLARSPCSTGGESRCAIGAGMFVARYAQRTLRHLGSDAKLPAGMLEVYIFTDGVAVMSLSIPELDGLVELEPSHLVSGEVVNLPVRCEPYTDCSMGYGGATRDVGESGFMGYFAFAKRPHYTVMNAPALGSVSVSGCRYTDRTDPEDHPRGCDVFPDDTSLDGIDATASFLYQATLERSGEAEFGIWDATGPVYGGFIAEAWSHEPGSDYGAYVLWISQGIA